jgi:hypothetical protein
MRVLLCLALVMLGQGPSRAGLANSPALLFWEDANETNTSILPNGQTTLSEIPLHGAPPQAIVRGMDVQVSIAHPSPGDLP